MTSCLWPCCSGAQEEAKKPSTFLDFTDSLSASWAQLRSKSVARLKIQNMETQINYWNPVAAEHQQRRQKIFSQPIRLNEDFRPPFFPKTPMQKAFLSNVLQENFMFADMTDEERDKFISAMEPEEVPAGALIIHQGDVGDFFYIVAQGTVDFNKDQVDVGSCHRGGSFGELALLYDSPRAASCVAKTDVSLYKVDQKTFRIMLARQAHDQISDIRELIRRIAIFQGLDEITLHRFTCAMTPVPFRCGDTIVQKGEAGNVFYIVQEGNVKIHDIGFGDSTYEDQILRPGDWFGERALLTGEPRAANVTALSERTILLAIDRSTFENTIGPLKGLVEVEMRKKILRGITLFAKSNLKDLELNQLAILMEEVQYEKGKYLAEAGKPCDMKLWIIRKGNLILKDPKSTASSRHLKNGDHFGEESLCGDPDQISAVDAVCEDDLTAWVLTREQAEGVLGDSQRLDGFGTILRKDSIDGSSVTLQDLKKHRVLGEGAFGRVWLVEHKQLRKVYALKTMAKDRLIQTKQIDMILREKNFLKILRHPFILHSVATFQDDHYLYLILPMISGGELFNVLHGQKQQGVGLPNKNAAFYSACVTEALGYFHSRSIAYRDLKLENVLIDEQGYCVIVDLGFAKVVTDKTYTLVGTPEYLAPEILLSKGHDKAVDYWSLGVLTYELLAGVSPFFRVLSTEMEMFRRIVRGAYNTPEYFSNDAKDLISKLLNRKEMERLGNLSRGAMDVKAHSWFEDSGVNFTSLLAKKVEAPWIPVVKNPLDSSNFRPFPEGRDSQKSKKLTKQEQLLFKDF